MTLYRTKTTDDAAYEQYLRGNSDKRSSLRDGNQALNRLLNNYTGRHPRYVHRLGSDLPIYGALLYGVAAREAVFFSQTKDEFVDAATQYGLSLSIFDFILFSYFSEVFQSLDHDKEAPSLLTDALLFQVSGQEASSIKEEDMLLNLYCCIRSMVISTLL